ncbi:hypothetical protein CALVIDRAFT_561608 [Calocera viscosa TUFC12733]|uniref:Uncharacterized protein n=1 Tax=Calocera viscosa (strain TUFC12733) TaxID=1330018 RepID=A0A167PXA8_CALVF|nr:hypothetical protein CALVIDRAFT_561608 [Calocera viscosa TUFC12733]
MTSYPSRISAFPALDRSWFSEGGIAWVPNQAKSPLLSFDDRPRFQPICVLDRWEPHDPSHPDDPITPEDFWRRALHLRTHLTLTGDIIPTSMESVVVEHDNTPFLPPHFLRPPLASPQTWIPTNLRDRAEFWAYTGCIQARIDTTSVALCGTGYGPQWHLLPPAVAYSEGKAFLDVVAQGVQFVLWRPAATWAPLWWTWIGAQLGRPGGEAADWGDEAVPGSLFIPAGMEDTECDPFHPRRRFQVGSASRIAGSVLGEATRAPCDDQDWGESGESAEYHGEVSSARSGPRMTSVTT